ncbi:MAG: class I SAM-dependent methyltransferase [Candidatus Electrothrix sp. MAN1_4]|nr:class I SAM-dependent methyltransferase [Candidatus Electrothrix sp. MAN1_4]
MHMKPWKTPWPCDELESVSSCPVCTSEERGILYSNLVDNVFFVAPGKWTMWQCKKCKSAYLDPRPNQASIGQAYKNYYTHNKEIRREEPGQLGRFRLFRRMLANGYLNDRYGTKYQPASRLGGMFAALFPAQREALDIQFRWLPKPNTGQRLLDFGCGNGGFLRNAREAGWHVVGVDIDSDAVGNAQKLGIEVYQGTTEIFDTEVESFDAITINHVLEHVPEPSELLSMARRLLKPGGVLYIDTPNIQSPGARIFGPNWRGLETPRHLVLLSRTGLKQLLAKHNFTDFQIKNRKKPRKDMFLQSHRMTFGLPPNSQSPKSLPLGLALRAKIPFITHNHFEFITLLARKRRS